MDWKTKYANKVMSADEAVKLIQSGDTVVFAHAVAEPVALVDAMVANKHLYKDITVSHMVTLGKGEYAKPENSDVFRYEGWFTSPSVRNSIVEGHGDFVPVFFHEIPSLIRRDMLHVDVIMVTVTPPDEHGYCNVGVSSDYTMQSIKSARVVLAEINDQVPTVFGNAYVHVDEIDAMVEFNRPLPES
ncbi:MAG: 4-hydroxybutyrate CoA-transferase, partial [Firmicutes bacterium]|nr:4-hydroxybutyrate CoA-transferase [Bacillota bacterium]